MTRASPTILVVALAVSSIGCVLVDNPNYLALDGETASEAESTSASESSSAADSSSSSSSSTLDTDTDSDTLADTTQTSDDPCLPGAAEIGCPCADEVTCALGLNCSGGVCSEPTNCPDPDPAIVVTLDPLANSLGPDVQLGLCELTMTIDDQSVIQAALTNCDGTLGDMLFAIGPLAPEDPALNGSFAASVLRRAVDRSTSHVRIETGSFVIWLVDAPTLDSGEPGVSDYPVPLAPSAGDCPGFPDLCGLSQRRAVQAGDLVVFDGQRATPSANVILWVDEAGLQCGVDHFRLALLAY
ncbi:hypothetical protein ACNOYE_27985 [Nannocystaceae bacterium ST9]